MPVVDSYNRLLGIVTVDDVMQILRDETTEDIHRLGGVDAVSYTHLVTDIFYYFKIYIL